MLFQRGGSGTLPPSGFSIPRWDTLKQQWESSPIPSTSTVAIGSDTVVLGHQDSEGDDLDPDSPLLDHTYGWDNESPPRAVAVKAFNAEWRPVTNGQFLEYLLGDGAGKVEVPKTWVEEDGVYKVSIVSFTTAWQHTQTFDHFRFKPSTDQSLWMLPSIGLFSPPTMTLKYLLRVREDDCPPNLNYACSSTSITSTTRKVRTWASDIGTPFRMLLSSLCHLSFVD